MIPDLQSRGIELDFAELKGPVKDRLRTYGLIDQDDEPADAGDGQRRGTPVLQGVRHLVARLGRLASRWLRREVQVRTDPSPGRSATASGHAVARSRADLT